MLPKGTYYVGDLCYVLNEHWEEVCDLTFEGNTSLYGEFELKNGIRFALYNTAHGDGRFHDQYNNAYPVDAGSIGCVLLSDININNPENNISLGNVHSFGKDFDCSTSGGCINIGHISIPTDDDCDNDYDYEY